MNRRQWRVCAMGAPLSLALSFGPGVGAAPADPQDHHQSSAEHAAQDLVGKSITQIERDTRAAAAKIKDTTGVAPGGHTKTQKVPNASLSAAAAADPGVGGAWGAVIPTDVVPIFQAVLPNGKVLMWDSVGDGPAESYTDHTFTRALVWNPETNTSVRRDVQGYNIFCAGYTQLADGRVLVAGGNKDSALNGIVQTHIFDWQTEAWSRGPDMASARWYPSVAALGNDEAVIVGGGPAVPEVYQTNGSLRRLTNATGYSDRSYPFLVPRPNGQVELVGPHNSMNTIDTSGTGAITAAQNRDGLERDYGSFATYDIGKVLVAGGGNLSEGGQSNVPTKTAVVVSVNSGTGVVSTASMSVGRRQHNLTVLADGSVLATGGMSRSVDGLVELDYPVFAAERWAPSTGTWTVLASASRVREYHSSAALLPDGRVLTGGGGVCGTCATKGYLEKNVEYFEPPYLFKTDGSGQRAARPVIDSAPATAGYGQSFAIASAQAGTIAKVGLVRLGAPTHSEDQGQRYVPLSFSASGTTITAASPATSNVAPAGYYMLFVTDTAGVPSVAKIIKLGVDTLAPTISVSALARFTLASSAGLHYSATDAGGVFSYDVRYRRAPYGAAFGALAYPSAWQATRATSVSLAVSRGSTYCYSARARDVAGNVSTWSVERCTASPLDERSLTASTGWIRATGSGYYAGTISKTSSTGRTLTRSGVQARRISVVATTCSGCGSIGVFWNGRLIRTISLNASSTHYRQLLAAASFSATGNGTVVVKSLSSSRVYVDGLALTRV